MSSSPIRMTGLVSNMDTESIIQSLMSAQSTKKTKIENKITKLEWKQETWKDLNKKIYSLYNGKLSKLRFQSSFMTKKAVSSNESVATVTASNSAPSGTHTLKVNSLASAQFLTGDQLSTDVNSKAITTGTLLTDLGMAEGNEITVTAGTTTKSLVVSGTTTVNDFLSTLKEAGLNASYDTTQKRFFISSKESGTENAFTLTASDSSELSKLGLDEVGYTDGAVSVAEGSIVSLVPPSDASFVYNGAELTSSTNDITVNGISLSLMAKTGTDETISLAITDDKQAVYDMVKDFVKEYNEVLKEMNEYYYADSARGYDPLTDDEKEAMSEDEIEKWETKIKDSLLRRDTTLSSLLDVMKTNLSQSVSVNGKSYSLSSFGIATSSDYTEKGLLHIAGDPDDTTTSLATDKLMAALTEDPEAVMLTLTELAGNLYDKLNENMSSTELRSALNVYNDKEIQKSIDNYENDLDVMEKRLQDMENRYYKQFSAMETALSKLNSQSNSLASMLGTDS